MNINSNKQLSLILISVLFSLFGTLSYASTNNYISTGKNGSGLGYIVLLPEDNKSFAEQLSVSNTIYEINNTYDLNGEIVKIPSGCILSFKGGSLKNGILVGDRTALEAPLYQIFESTLSLLGTWTISEAYPQWYGARGDGRTDDSDAIQNTLNNFIGVIRLPVGVYSISHKIAFKDNRILEGVGTGTYLRESGYSRISVIRPTSDFKGDCVLDFDPANYSKGSVYITGATCRRLIVDCVNIKNNSITIINILSLSNPETFENIRIINNNNNVGLRVGRSANKRSFESDGIVFSNIVFLDGGSHYSKTPCAIIGPCNEISFRDCKFMPASSSDVKGSNSVMLDASQMGNTSRAVQGIVFDNCSFTASEKALIIKGNRTDGNGPRNIMVSGCTFENVATAIYAYSTDPKNKPVQFCTFIGKRFHSNSTGQTYVLGEGACNNEVFPLDNQTTILDKGAINNLVLGGIEPQMVGNGATNGYIHGSKIGVVLTSPQQEVWEEPTLMNNWRNASPTNRTTIAYRKTKDGKLELRGYLKSGNWTYPNNLLFTLPLEYRPKTSKVLSVGGEEGESCILEILNTGQVQAKGKGALLLLDGVVVSLD